MRKNFSSYCIYLFSSSHLQVRPLGRFLLAMAQTTRSREGCAFWGLKDLKLIFNVFIQKLPMAPMGKIKHFFKRS